MSDVYLVDNEWAGTLESVVGKFEVYPERQGLWEFIKAHPDQFQISFSYIDNDDGTKELVGMSVTRKSPEGLGTSGRQIII